eukprot:gnl/TRDRNA2_/TRDRNA2_156221_c0_seq1.p1 gnl/TRDRNA2_/TRDRNA2_156221_c0~~gnl/TRDRNA2_/TRDRNA2_156221_c0_seq1.p1  ORF type:complete len:285 (+),score=15.38 gnl/TRDRNA2_/TRDRNA2_156221_c0_seq1:103-855(+)
MDEWVGSVFPEKTKKKDYLSEYIKKFNSVELNGTFYNVKKANMQSWAETAKGSKFKFCPKFNRRISHIKRLKDEVFELTDYFVEMCLNFGDNLGISFLQMPENFGPKWFDRLHDFVVRLPKDFPMAVELRHAEWYVGEAFDEFFSMLKEYNKTAVITDTALKRNIIHQRLTNDKVFVRFAGYEDHPSNKTRLDEWADRLKKWSDQGLSEVYFFCKHEDESFSPYTADYMIGKVNEKMNLSISSPFAAVDG